MWSGFLKYTHVTGQEVETHQNTRRTIKEAELTRSLFIGVELSKPWRQQLHYEIVYDFSVKSLTLIRGHSLLLHLWHTVLKILRRINMIAKKGHTSFNEFVPENHRTLCATLLYPLSFNGKHDCTLFCNLPRKERIQFGIKHKQMPI